MRVAITIKKIQVLFAICALSLVSIGNFATIPANALAKTYDPGLVVSKDDLYLFPSKFDSAEAIQKYLADQQSVLATYPVQVSFEPDDDIINPATFAAKPDYLQPNATTGPYLGKTISAAQLIWLMSQTDFGNGCGISQQEVCFDNRSRAINPVFVLALIQKESGLVYGANATKPASDSQTQFLLDRATGYYCFESNDPSQSCYDQNPGWKYFKGFFRQVYYAVRFLRVWDVRCNLGGSYSYNNDMGKFMIGSQVQIGGKIMVLRSSMACAFYIYTPNLSGQELYWKAFNQISSSSGSKNLGQEDLANLSELTKLECKPQADQTTANCQGILPDSYLPPKDTLKLGSAPNRMVDCSFSSVSGKYVYNCNGLSIQGKSNNIFAAIGDSKTFKTTKTVVQLTDSLALADLRNVSLTCNNNQALQPSGNYLCTVNLPDTGKTLGDLGLKLSFDNPSGIVSTCSSTSPTRLICPGVRTGPTPGSQILYGQIGDSQRVPVKSFQVGVG